jgi:hypothetical protein
MASASQLRSRLRAFLSLSVSLLFLAGAAPAWGHSFGVTTSIDCLGGGGSCPQEAIHEDAVDWKGWFWLTVTNTGTEDWGDFHFELFPSPPDFEDITNVVFDVSSPNEPTSNRTSLSWDLSPDGHVLDLFFYSDPVKPGEALEINVFTDNTTDMVPLFGTLYYPTPVPEPTTYILITAGLMGLAVAGRRRRH